MVVSFDAYACSLLTASVLDRQRSALTHGYETVGRFRGPTDGRKTRVLPDLGTGRRTEGATRRTAGKRARSEPQGRLLALPFREGASGPPAISSSTRRTSRLRLAIENSVLKDRRMPRGRNEFPERRRRDFYAQEKERPASPSEAAVIRKGGMPTTIGLPPSS